MAQKWLYHTLYTSAWETLGSLRKDANDRNTILSVLAQVVTTYAALARNLSTISAHFVLRHQVSTLRFINVNCPPTRRGIFPVSFLGALIGIFGATVETRPQKKKTVAWYRKKLGNDHFDVSRRSHHFKNPIENQEMLQVL